MTHRTVKLWDILADPKLNLIICGVAIMASFVLYLMNDPIFAIVNALVAVWNFGMGWEGVNKCERDLLEQIEAYEKIIKKAHERNIELTIKAVHSAGDEK